MSTLIKLNVGGVKYLTTKDTLLQSQSTFFHSLLLGSCGNAMDSDGYYFIDRDGHLFEPILSFMRTGHFEASEYSTITLTKLYREVDFFGIRQLIDILSPTKKSGCHYLIDKIIPRDNYNNSSNGNNSNGTHINGSLISSNGISHGSGSSNNNVSFVMSRANLVFVVYQNAMVDVFLYKGITFHWLHLVTLETPPEIQSIKGLKVTMTKTKTNEINTLTLLATTNEKKIVLWKITLDTMGVKATVNQTNLLKLNHFVHFSNFIVNGHYLTLVSRSGIITIVDCGNDLTMKCMYLPYKITTIADVEYILLLSCENGKIYEIRQNIRDNWDWELEDVFELDSKEFYYPSYGFSKRAWESSTGKGNQKNTILKEYIVDNNNNNEQNNVNQNNQNNQNNNTQPTSGTSTPTSPVTPQSPLNTSQTRDHEDVEDFNDLLVRRKPTIVGQTAPFKLQPPSTTSDTSTTSVQGVSNNNNNNEQNQNTPYVTYITSTSIQNTYSDSRYAMAVGTMDGYIHLGFRGTKYPDFQLGAKFWIGVNEPICKLVLSGGSEGIFVTAQSCSGIVKTWQYKSSNQIYPSSTKCINSFTQPTQSINFMSPPLISISKFKTYSNLFFALRNQPPPPDETSGGNSNSNNNSNNNNVYNTMKRGSPMMNSTLPRNNTTMSGMSISSQSGGASTQQLQQQGGMKLLNSPYNQIYITGGDINSNYELVVYPLNHRINQDTFMGSDFTDSYYNKPIARIPMVDLTPISRILLVTYGGSEPTLTDIAYQILTVHESNAIYAYDLRDIDKSFPTLISTTTPLNN